MKRYILKVLVLGAAVASSAAFAKKDGYEFSAGTGSAWSYEEDITIKRDGEKDIDLGLVNFDTNPFKSPLYYDLRVSKWKDNSAWEIELIHHKIYAKKGDLNTSNTEVSKFEITDGYNLLYGNYAQEVSPGNIARFGVGLVIPHPDVIINGERSHGPYQLGGVAFQAGIEHEFPINDSFIFSIEGKMTYSYAKINIDNGSSIVPNTAAHLQFHIKYMP